MSDIRSSSDDDADGELKKALAAAFGDDALQWLSELAPDIGESPGEVETADLPGSRIGLNQDLSISAPRYIICQIDDRQFGLPLDGVTEIVRQATITPLPRTPSWLRGVTNLRSQIVSVVDLRELWNATDNPRPPAGRERIVVVHNSTADVSTAIVVDQILGIKSFEGDHQFDSHGDGTLPEIASGLISVDPTPIVLIDPDRLLGCADLQMFAT